MTLGLLTVQNHLRKRGLKTECLKQGRLRPPAYRSGANEMDNKSTCFMDFWEAINRELKKHNLPELRFKDAREIWENTIREAHQRSFENYLKNNKINA